VQGRATQGVRIIDLKKRGDEIASVCRVLTEEDEPELSEELDPTATSVAPELAEGSATQDQLPQELLDRAMDEDLNK
jgi:DNA gyrase, A subunit